MNITYTNDQIVQSMDQVISDEIQAVRTASALLPKQNCVEAIKLIVDCSGKVVFTGVGKSGHIAEKLAATFASVGIPSFFMHATEAVHGDLGMVTSEDLVIAISNSGKTTEVLKILPVLHAKKIKMVSITGDDSSPLAQAANISLKVHVNSEADDFNLAPTSSSTAVLVVGDALALTASRLLGFDEQGFGLNHPGGALGKKLIAKGVLKEAQS